MKAFLEAPFTVRFVKSGWFHWHYEVVDINGLVVAMYESFQNESANNKALEYNKIFAVFALKHRESWE